MLHFMKNGAKYRAYAVYDDEPEDPRKDFEGNICTLLLYWPRLSIGDRDYKDPDELLKDLALYVEDIDSDEDTFDYDLKDYIEYLSAHGFYIKPVFGYEHSGFSISLVNSYPYNDRFDGGCCGVAIIDDEDYEEYTEEEADEIVKSEIELYNSFLDGDAYGIIVEKKTSSGWAEEDSCYGFLFTTYDQEKAEKNMLESIMWPVQNMTYTDSEIR